MKKCTLCFLVDGGKVLLGRKKRGFGEGKWNGFGGKVVGGETIKQAALRELLEESFISANEEDLKKVAEMKFIFDDMPEAGSITFVYIIEKWQEESRESEEMFPQWFDMDDMPFGDMWPCDVKWIPEILSGKKIKGAAYFKGEGDFYKMEMSETDF